MATLKELKAEAKAAGIAGFSSMNKARLEATLDAATNDVAGPDAVEPEPIADVGEPTEPERGGLTVAEIKNAQATIGAAGQVPGLGVPTEPDKAGDMSIPEVAEKIRPGPSPSHTGQAGEIGVPTEPKRGGVNALELELSKR